MAKKIEDVVLDQSLIKAATGTTIRLMTAEATNRADAITKTLASGTLTPGDGNGDFTLAAGDVSGRKVTVEQQADLSITTTGASNHVSIDDGTILLLQTTHTSQALTSGNTVTINAWDYENRQAT